MTPSAWREASKADGPAASPSGTRLLTVGHGTASTQELLSVLRGAHVNAVVDIRRFPGSRAHPHVGREELAQSLPAEGFSYRWEPRLGGRRHLAKGTASPDSWWKVEAFRAYAAHTRTPELAQALSEVLEQAAAEVVTVMCSETVWWRCHRRLVADVSVLAKGAEVWHVLPPATLRPHQPAAGARLLGDGSLVWDRPTT